MILYFIERFSDTYIKKDNEEIIYDKKSLYINHLAKISLVSIKEYIKLIKSNNIIKSAIPIYLNKELILFKVKYNNDFIYFNYSAIANIGYDYEKVCILFKNEEYLLLSSINYKVFKKAIDNIKKLIEYKKKLVF